MDDKILLEPMILRFGLLALSLLAGINVFFIKGLINKIDRADKSIAKYEEQIRQLKETIDGFSFFIKEFTELKSEIAVIKYALKHGGKNGSDI